MTIARAALVSLAACLLAACGSRARDASSTVDIADAAADASNSVAAYDRVTPRRLLPAGMPAVAVATYRCAGAVTLDARFDNRADNVRLRGAGIAATLAGQHPASGIWYGGKGGELRGKGRNATFTYPDGRAIACVADD
ncbi:hypothetical protein ASG29_13860 [Sphingomonas sp. Leaf412]|uniref:MliC family protein n=1 Tax=Sphingomonas sp. Leaf412 TaxID=1736370 RepID=UPI0006FC0A1A|nr:MliC family protein [Sphingomonas sp. Leaf412]KQT32780.1 hypothetical protein ASG29_13860 [Sphingomonas sp. Leaf412]